MFHRLNIVSIFSPSRDLIPLLRSELRLPLLPAYQIALDQEGDTLVLRAFTHVALAPWRCPQLRLIYF